jgi:hypothetical protein
VTGEEVAGDEGAGDGVVAAGAVVDGFDADGDVVGDVAGDFGAVADGLGFDGAVTEDFVDAVVVDEAVDGAVVESVVAGDGAVGGRTGAALDDVSMFDARASTFEPATGASVFSTGFSAGASSASPFMSNHAPAPASARSISRTNTINPIGRFGGITIDCEPCAGVTIGGRRDVCLLIESSSLGVTTGVTSSASGVGARDEPGPDGILSEPGSGVGIALCGGIDIGGLDCGGCDAGPCE